MADSELAPKFAPFFGMAGIASAVSFSTRQYLFDFSLGYMTNQLLLFVAPCTDEDSFSFFLSASQMIFGSIGAAYGTAKSGIGIAGVGTFRSDLIMKSLIPVVMAGIISVYGLVIAVLISGDMGPPPQKTYSLYTGFMHLAAGLSVGLAGLAAGYTIGIVGDVVSSESPGPRSQPLLLHAYI
ncbi:V-type ATPase, C subunit [Emergomyces pasteurianus Ep9510]|uniref:V-type proton ATPase proteolipid subunit n=1 Tax=Emergomyces pasteurianus Ep9510 TaxID=1447872 RepID=A0A1J9P568_9EURO|nr:V-type ATPase, C subunit [Emergomyces pasteurianus Ep9510]